MTAFYPTSPFDGVLSSVSFGAKAVVPDPALRDNRVIM
jgi:hypothetical protein